MNNISKQRKGLSFSEAGKLGGEYGAKYNKELRAKNISDYNCSPKTCSFCNNLLPYDKRHNKYCNKSCAASKNNLGVRRNFKKTNSITGSKNDKICVKKIYLDRQCLNCNKTISYKYKYCNLTCVSELKWKQSKLLVENNQTKSPNLIRKYLKEKYNNTCQSCFLSTWKNKQIPLEIEHIDGNSENNSTDNLTLLCCNCHAQTDTYKAKNLGNGRFLRRKRYSEGKSY